MTHTHTGEGDGALGLALFVAFWLFVVVVGVNICTQEPYPDYDFIDVRGRLWHRHAVEVRELVNSKEDVRRGVPSHVVSV